MKKILITCVIIITECLLLTACSSNSKDSEDITAKGFSDAEIESAMQTVWHEYDNGNNFDITTERTYQRYISGLSYDLEKQKTMHWGFSDDDYSADNRIYLSCDIVEILREGSKGWEAVMEFPDWGYWLVREDADAQWEIYGQGY